MLIHNLVATGSLSYNGVNISYVTGSQTSLDGLNQFSASVNTTTGSLSSSIAILSGSYLTMSGSYSSASGSLSTRVTTIESKYATTGSNIFTGAQTVCANITSTGTIIAQTLNVQQVTSSIVYSSGSNTFGCLTTDRQQFTGSVTMTGSLAVFTSGTSPEFQVLVGGTTHGNALTDTHNVTGSLRITGSFNTIGNACITSVCSPAIVGGTFSGTTGVFSGQVCANSNLTAAGTIYGRTTNNFPTTGAGYYAITTNNFDAERGGITIRVSSATNTLTDALTINYLGAATFSGQINANSTGPLKLESNNETTNIAYANFVNTSGFLRWGIEGSTGNGLFTGTSAYSSVIGTVTNTSLHIATNTNVRMTITGGGNVGIGTTSPTPFLNANARTLAIEQTGTNPAEIAITGQNANLYLGNGGLAAYVYSTGAYPLLFGTNGTERMRITSGGSVVFQCSLNMCNGGAINMTIPSGTNGGSIRMACCTGPNEGDMFLTGGSGNIGILIAGSGRVGIGTTTPSYALQVNGPSNSNAAYFRAGGTAGYASVAFSGESGTALGVLATTAGCIFLGRANGTIGNQFGAEGDIMINCANGNVRMNNSLTIVGSLSKGSGSFRIKHPLLSKKCTYQLVHSFIEGPQADLIYSGRTTLTNGVSCINIDCTARMTQGTFEALNRCVRVFTTNESSWDQVRGKVVGNILVIESQNSESTDNISWMVIGERQDEHMFETEWTDHEGRVITEPEVKE